MSPFDIANRASQNGTVRIKKHVFLFAVGLLLELFCYALPIVVVMILASILFLAAYLMLTGETLAYVPLNVLGALLIALVTATLVLMLTFYRLARKLQSSFAGARLLRQSGDFVFLLREFKVERPRPWREAAQLWQYLRRSFRSSALTSLMTPLRRFRY